MRNFIAYLAMIKDTSPSVKISITEALKKRPKKPKAPEAQELRKCPFTATSSQTYRSRNEQPEKVLKAGVLRHGRTTDQRLALRPSWIFWRKTCEKQYSCEQQSLPALHLLFETVMKMTVIG
jgi:hypothetical protein